MGLIGVIENHVCLNTLIRLKQYDITLDNDANGEQMNARTHVFNINVTTAARYGLQAFPLICAMFSDPNELRHRCSILVCSTSSCHEKHLQAYPFNPLLAAFIWEP